MTQKEFLESFIEHAEAMGYLSDQDIGKFIDNFLEYHHQTYFEVEFVRIDEEDIQVDPTGNVYKIKDGEGKLVGFSNKTQEELLSFKGVPIKFDDVVNRLNKTEEISDTETIEIKRISPIEFTAEQIRNMYNEMMKNNETKIKSSLHVSSILNNFPIVVDDNLPDDRIEIHDQNGQIYVLINIK